MNYCINELKIQHSQFDFCFYKILFIYIKKQFQLKLVVNLFILKFKCKMSKC